MLWYTFQFLHLCRHDAYYVTYMVAVAWHWTDCSEPDVPWTHQHRKRILKKATSHEQSNLMAQRAKPSGWGQLLWKSFTTSKMGLNIWHTGVGDRDGWSQTKFRGDIMAVYGSKHPTRKWAWCPIPDSCRRDTTQKLGLGTFLRHLGKYLDARNRNRLL